MSISQSNDTIKLYFHKHQEALDLFENPYLKEKDEYAQSLYYRMLCEIVRYPSSADDMQVLYIRRLMIGTQAEHTFEDYMKMAFGLDSNDINDFVSIFGKDVLRYYFCVDSLILLSATPTHTESYTFLSELIELLGISKDELRYLSAVAAAIVTQSSQSFDEAKTLTPRSTKDISFHQYVKWFYTGSCTNASDIYRLTKLKQLTDDMNVLKNIDSVAFDQEELLNLYNHNIKEIYLCEGEFEIPESKQSLTYILIGSPTVKGLSESQLKDKNSTEDISIESLVMEKLGKFIDPQSSLFFIDASLSKFSSISDMRYNGWNVHSESEIKRRAKDKFVPVYLKAQEYFDTYPSRSIAKQATESLFNLVNNDLLTISNAINQLSENITSKNADIIKEFLSLIDPSTLKKRIRDIADEELNDSYYRLTECSYYTDQIDYTDLPHDPPGLFGKKDWWFNAMPAWCELNDDVRKLTDDYTKYVTKQFYYSFVSPLISLSKKIER